MSADVAEGRTAVLATQGTTKVYKHAGKTVSDSEEFDASDGEWAYSADDAKTRRATLVSPRASHRVDSWRRPDPVQAFRGSRFRQTQKIALARDASLVVVDWIVAGRAAFHGGGAGGFTSGRGGGLAPSEDPKPASRGASDGVSSRTRPRPRCFSTARCTRWNPRVSAREDPGAGR